MAQTTSIAWRLVVLGLLLAATVSAAQKGTEEAQSEEALQVREELERLAEEQAEIEEELQERLRRLQELGEVGAVAAAEATAQAREAAAEAQARAGEVAQGAAREAERWRRSRVGEDQKFAIGSTVRVREGEVASEVFALGGRIEIEGEVKGGAVAILGPVEVKGKVHGDVVSVGSDVYLAEGSEVTGSVTSVGGEVERADGAIVGGKISEPTVGIDLGDLNVFSGGNLPDFSRRGGWSLDEWFSLFWALVMTGFYVILCGMMMVIAPRAVDNVRRTAARDTWKCALLGLAIGLLVVPATVVLVFLLVVSIIGIPFLVLIPFVYLFLFAAGLFGLAGVSVATGRVVKQRLGVGFSGGVAAMLVGIVALRALGLCGDLLNAVGMPWMVHGMFGLSGFLVWFGACCVALGAVFLSRLGQTGPPELPPLPGA